MIFITSQFIFARQFIIKYIGIILNTYIFLCLTQNYLIIQITEVQHAIDQLKRKLDTDKMKLIIEVKVIYISPNHKYFDILTLCVNSIRVVRIDFLKSCLV